MNEVVLEKEDGAVFSFTQDGGAARDHVEHGVELGRRTRDHLKHLGGRHLLGERLFEIAGLGLHGLEQAHVLDGDDSLIGEASHQVDGAFAEQARLRLGEHEHAFDLAVAQQWNAEQGAHVHALRRRHLKLRVRLVVRNLLDAAGERDAPGDAVAPRSTRAAVARIGTCDLRAESRLGAV